MNETITLCLEIIFWLALFVVFYTYLGYGIVLYILVKLKELFVKPVKRSLPASDACRTNSSSPRRCCRRRFSSRGSVLKSPVAAI